MKLHLNKLIFVLATFFLFNLSSWGQKLILSIDQGEEILYPESSISLNDKQGGIQVCTVDNSGNYYVYSEGIKKGPFSKKENAFEKIAFPNTSNESNTTPEHENKAWEEDYVTINEKGESFLKVNGKTMGPYSTVRDLYITADGKHFAAITGKLRSDQSFMTDYFLSSADYPEVKLSGEPGILKASQSLKTAVVCTEETITQEIDMKSIEDYSAQVEKLMKEFETSEMSVDDINKMGEKMEQIKKPESLQSKSNHYIYINSGTKIDLLESCPGEKELNFGINSGEKWFYFENGKLFISGKLEKDFGDNKNITNFWWSKNGNGYAFSTYSELIFSDGKTYPFPLSMILFEENGKTFLKWITLEENRNFIIYQKEL